MGPAHELPMLGGVVMRVWTGPQQNTTQSLGIPLYLQISGGYKQDISPGANWTWNKGKETLNTSVKLIWPGRIFGHTPLTAWIFSNKSCFSVWEKELKRDGIAPPPLSRVSFSCRYELNMKVYSFPRVSLSSKSKTASEAEKSGEVCTLHMSWYWRQRLRNEMPAAKRLTKNPSLTQLQVCCELKLSSQPEKVESSSSPGFDFE